LAGPSFNMKIKDLILDILFSKVCINCGREGKYICDKCSIFVSEAMPVCPNCYNPSFLGETHQNCIKEYGLDGLTSMWDYEGLVKRLIHNIKYGGLSHIIDECVESSFKLIAADISRFNSFLSFLSSDNTYITYVPMHIKKKKRRGFNQSELIAKELAKKANLRPVFGQLLEKVVDTKDQAKLEKRIGSVKASFAINGNVDGIESVLLVDDVYITGATMRECCKALKQSGIKKVWAFTFARIP